MKRLTVFGLVVVVLIVGFILWWIRGVAAVTPTDLTTRMFVIPPGSTIREIGANLKKEGFINDQVIFFLYVKQKGVDRAIQAGDYRLSGSMNLDRVVEELTHGTLDIWITIPEGRRAEEYAEILKKNFSQYDPSWEEVLKEKNGYLFPDTYLIPKNADIVLIADTMNNTFYTKITQLGLDKNSSKLSQIVIIASLIEREAKTDAERPIIAGIINNRLSDGMPLQIDATLQYVRGFDEDSKRWWASVGDADKTIASPYNTYLYIGLPPTPIANPGIESLKAAINPDTTDYYYYLHDTNGKIHYAKTLMQHNQNINTYLR